MFVFPANKNAVLPQVFKKHAKITDKLASLPFDKINKQRENWIQAWTESVL